jgi:4a-hydroxytetrahydrobiopterin dehydratase
MSLASDSPRLSRKRIVSCVMMNLVATPGLGSFLAHRRVAGIGQILLSIVGFLLLLDWFYQLVVVQYFGQIMGEVKIQPVGYIGLIGGGVFVASWLWSLATSISLLQEASHVAAKSLRSFGAKLIKLDEGRVGPALLALPAWQRAGDTISRTYQFKDFPAAMQFVNAIAAMAEEAQHHPDIDVRWNQVTLALTTHDVGGLTELDFAMARECDAQAQS